MVKRWAMKKMAAGAFKAKCLAILDEVCAKREAVVITKHGKPVAKIGPVSRETADIHDFLAGKGRITGDVILPALASQRWGELA